MQRTHDSNTYMAAGTAFCLPPMPDYVQASTCVFRRGTPKKLYTNSKYSYQVYKQVRRMT